MPVFDVRTMKESLGTYYGGISRYALWRNLSVCIRSISDLNPVVFLTFPCSYLYWVDKRADFGSFRTTLIGGLKREGIVSPAVHHMLHLGLAHCSDSLECLTPAQAGPVWEMGAEDPTSNPAR